MIRIHCFITCKELEDAAFQRYWRVSLVQSRDESSSSACTCRVIGFPIPDRIRRTAARPKL
jgi:hypothetical protein